VQLHTLTSGIVDEFDQSQVIDASPVQPSPAPASTPAPALSGISPFVVVELNLRFLTRLIGWLL
jgi:hypothetical protein